MSVLAVATASVLFLIAALHAYWGMGGVWPGVDEQSCARAVTGFAGRTRMPGPAAAFAVAAVLALAALVALAQGGLVVTPFPPVLPLLATLAAMTVFLGRGMAGFTPAWRRLTPELPFARLDVILYSPMCLTIGAAFAVLAILG